MAEIINLNRARKARDRTAAALKSVENRAKFGRTGAQKAANRAEAERRARELDGAKLD